MVGWRVIVQYSGIDDELLDRKMGFGGCWHSVEIPLVVREHRAGI